MSKVYIAGPMTGYDQFNKPAFMDVENYLRNVGFEVFNPAVEQEIKNLDECNGFEPLTPEERKRIIRKDLEGIMSSDQMFMLKGWEKSTGARAEHAVAVWLEMEIGYE